MGPIGGTVADLAVKLSLQSQSFQRDIAGVVDGVMGMQNKILRSVENVGKGLTARLTVPIGLSGAMAIKTAADYEKSMNQIIALTNNTKKDLDAMKGSVMALSGETARSPQELAEALYFVASAGVEVKDQMDVLATSAKASAVGMGSTQDVARATAAVLNAYGASNITATDAVDTLTRAVNEGTAEAGEYATSIGNVLPIASALGVSFQDVMAGISGITLSGQTASEAVTQMASMLRFLVKPTTQAEKVLKKYNLSLDELQAGVQTDLLGTMQGLAETFRGNERELNKLMGRQEGILGFLSLTGANASKVEDIFASMAGRTGELGRALDVMSQDPAFRVKRAMEAMSAAAMQFGAVLLPLVATIADAIAKLATAFGSLPAPVKAATAVFLLFTASLGPAIWIGTKVVHTFVRMKIALALLGAVFKFAHTQGLTLTGMISRMTGITTKATGIITSMIGKMSLAFKGASAAVGGSINVIRTVIVGSVAHIQSAIGGLVISVGGAMVRLAAAVATTAPQVSASFMAMGESAILSGRMMQAGAADGIAAMARMRAAATTSMAAGAAPVATAKGGFFAGLAIELAALAKVIGRRFKTIGDAISKGFDKQAAGAVRSARRVGSGITTALSRTHAGIMRLWAGLGRVLLHPFRALGGVVRVVARAFVPLLHPIRALKGLGDVVRGINGALNAVGRSLRALHGGWMRVWGMMGRVLLHPVQTIWGLAKALARGVIGLRGLATAAVGALRVFAKWTVIGTVIIAVIRMLWQGWRTFLDWLNSNLQKGVKWFRDLWGTVGEGGGVLDWIRTALETLMGAFKVLEDIIINAFGVIWRVVEPLVALAFSVIGNGITAVVKLLQGDFPGAIRAVQRIFGDFIGGAIALLIELVKAASGASKGIVDAFDWIAGPALNFDESTGGLDPLIKNLERSKEFAYGLGEEVETTAEKATKAARASSAGWIRQAMAAEVAGDSIHNATEVMSLFGKKSKEQVQGFRDFVEGIRNGVNDVSGIMSTLVGDMESTGHDIEHAFTDRIDALQKFKENIIGAMRQGLNPRIARDLWEQAMSDPVGANHIARHLNLEEGTRKAANKSVRVLDDMGKTMAGRLRRWGKYGANAFDPMFRKMQRLKDEIDGLLDERSELARFQRLEPELAKRGIAKIDEEIGKRRSQISKLKDAADGIADVTEKLKDEAGAADSAKAKIDAIKNAHHELAEEAKTTSGRLGEVLRQLDSLSSFTGDGVGDGIGVVKAAGDGFGMGGGGGSRAAMAATLTTMVPGTQVTSTFRPGSVTSYGNKSYHADPSNPAQDIAGTPAQMMAVFRMAQAMFGSSLKELIYTPAGYSIKNGQIVAPIAAADHYDHVHLADKGGTFRGPGLVRIGPIDEHVFQPAKKISNRSGGGGNTYNISVSAGSMTDERRVERVIREVIEDLEQGEATINRMRDRRGLLAEVD